jgi:hypothetical protein
MKIIITTLLLLSISLFGKIYQYKDSYGKVHYVDDISKVPESKQDYIKTMNTRFLKTNSDLIDKYRKLILKNGVYYKKLEEQKKALLSWGSIIVSYGFVEFKIDLSRIQSISFTDKKGKKLNRKQMAKTARILSSFFKSFESNWPKVYEEIHFKKSRNEALDVMRKHRSTVKTGSDNLSFRVKLLEEWVTIMKKNKDADTKLIDERMSKITSMYDVPKPNIEILSKYMDETIDIFEKEFRK